MLYTFVCDGFAIVWYSELIEGMIVWSHFISFMLTLVMYSEISWDQEPILNDIICSKKFILAGWNHWSPNKPWKSMSKFVFSTVCAVGQAPLGGRASADAVIFSRSERPALEELTHWGWDKMAFILQTTLSNAFSWMEMLEFWLTSHWSLLLRFELTIFQHWFR